MPWWFADEPLDDEPQARRLPFGKMVRRVAPLLRPHLASLAVGILLLLVSVACQLAGPLVLRRLIDVDIASGSRAGVVWSALTLRRPVPRGRCRDYLQVVVLTRMGLSHRHGPQAHALRAPAAASPWRTSTRTRPVRLLARVESDTERLQALFSEVSIAVLRTFVLIAGMLVVMLVANWRATLAVLALAGPLVDRHDLLLPLDAWPLSAACATSTRGSPASSPSTYRACRSSRSSATSGAPRSGSRR